MKEVRIDSAGTVGMPDFNLMREVGFISDRFNEWHAVTPLAVDDPEYDCFAAGFKIAVGTIEAALAQPAPGVLIAALSRIADEWRFKFLEPHEIAPRMQEIARNALAAVEKAPLWQPTEENREAIRLAEGRRETVAVLADGSVAFLNYGSEPDDEHLNCPACGGSGHVGDTRSGAVLDVLAERRRQIEAEGWTPEHDDEHSAGELLAAASCYIAEAAGTLTDDALARTWPWLHSWWKPTTARRDLVKATALIFAEIERRDRAAAQKPGDAS